MSSQNNLIEKFIYSLSHDLRAPIASIQGLVRIAEYYPRHDEIHKCLEMIETCTHNMNKQLSKLEEYLKNNQYPVHAEQYSAYDIINIIRDEFKIQIAMYDIEFVADIRTPTPWTMDKNSTLTLIKYLVSNSIAYHDPEKTNKKITVRMESNEMGATLEVSDNGKGIKESQQKNIFDIFFRGTEDSIGLGMGLFLAKSLTEKMEGSISCTSVENETTSMVVTFKNQ